MHSVAKAALCMTMETFTECIFLGCMLKNVEEGYRDGAKGHLSDSMRTHHYYPSHLTFNDFSCQSRLQLSYIPVHTYARGESMRDKDII